MREKLIGKKRFYIILFICVCLVAVTSIWISRSNLNKMESQDDPIKTEDFIIVSDGNEDKENEEPILEMSKMEGGKLEENTENDEYKEDKVDKEDEYKKDDQVSNEDELASNLDNNIETFAIPVNGKLIKDYTSDNLVYSKTLEEWTGHEGIDIEGKVGTTVKACANGTVTDVYKDDLWGIVIVIDHGNNLKTKYANLSTDAMVKEGLNVKKGDPISGIGNPTGIEMDEVPHLHFEVISNGKKVDPKIYLPEYK